MPCIGTLAPRPRGRACLWGGAVTPRVGPGTVPGAPRSGAQPNGTSRDHQGSVQVNEHSPGSISDPAGCGRIAQGPCCSQTQSLARNGRGTVHVVHTVLYPGGCTKWECVAVHLRRFGKPTIWEASQSELVKKANSHPPNGKTRHILLRKTPVLRPGRPPERKNQAYFTLKRPIFPRRKNGAASDRGGRTAPTDHQSRAYCRAPAWAARRVVEASRQGGPYRQEEARRGVQVFYWGSIREGLPSRNSELSSLAGLRERIP